MQTVLKIIVAAGVVIAVTTFAHAQNTPPNPISFGVAVK